jgi:hypothetical protein
MRIWASRFAHFHGVASPLVGALASGYPLHHAPALRAVAWFRYYALRGRQSLSSRCMTQANVFVFICIAFYCTTNIRLIYANNLTTYFHLIRNPKQKTAYKTLIINGICLKKITPKIYLN